LIFSLFAFGGCAILEPPSAPPASLEPHSQVYVADYDQVWRAMQKAAAGYPLQTNNIDQGILETDTVKHGQIWQAPFKRDRKQLLGRYRLKFKITKGKVSGHESMRVTITKMISQEKDFFSGEDNLPSDGFEEKALLYRIERELDIEATVKKAFEQNNS
jgi:hypothetical protein